MAAETILPIPPHDLKGRIHIIGGPGTGKSTLAKRLSQILSLPVYELDKIAFEGRDFKPRPLEMKKMDVGRIARQSEWIAEGMFLGWTDQLLVAAEVIIWLDQLSWPVAALRISRRFLVWGVAEAKRQPGVRKFNRFNDYIRNARQLYSVLHSTREYYSGSANARLYSGRESRIATLDSLTRYSDKLIHCQTEEQIRSLISEFSLIERQQVSTQLQ